MKDRVAQADAYWDYQEQEQQRLADGGTTFSEMVATAEAHGLSRRDAIDLAYDILDWLEGFNDAPGFDDKGSWDGICVVCGHDFRRCQGACTCLSCAAERQAMVIAMTKAGRR